MKKKKDKIVNKIMGGNRFRPYSKEFKNAPVGAGLVSAQCNKYINNIPVGADSISAKNHSGITLIALVVTIIILLILAGVVLSLTIGKSGIINNAELAGKETNKQTATEKINLKITNSQMNSYATSQRMPTLQELADDFCEDNEIEYVTLKSKKLASLDKIEVGENSSIFTKLKEYPYEFEINSFLQIARIDGVEVASNKTNKELNLNSLHNFKQIYHGENTASGNYSYKLEKDYSLILIVVYGIGTTSGSDNAISRINNSDVIKVLDNDRVPYSANRYATAVTAGYMVNAKKDTVIEMSFSYYGNAYIYALGE